MNFSRFWIEKIINTEPSNQTLIKEHFFRYKSLSEKLSSVNRRLVRPPGLGRELNAR